MKQLVIAAGMLMLQLVAHGQTDSIYVWNKWSARKDTLLLFTAANNTIQLYSKGMAPADYKLKSLDKNLRIGKTETKNDTLTVMAMPYAGKDKKMRLAILNAKTNKVIKTLNFACDSVPRPTAQLGNIKGNEAPKKTILEQMGLKVVFPGSLYSYPYRIKSYTFKIQTAKGSAVIPMTGISLTAEIIKQIGEAPEGTMIEFTNIQVTCPECVTKTVEDMKMMVK